MSAPNKSSSKSKTKSDQKPSSNPASTATPTAPSTSTTSQATTASSTKPATMPAHSIPTKFNQQLHQAHGLVDSAAQSGQTKSAEAAKPAESKPKKEKPAGEATTPKEKAAPSAADAAKPKQAENKGAGSEKPEGESEEPTKSAADIRRERREKQEEQRARKAAAAANKAPPAQNAAAKPQQTPKPAKPAGGAAPTTSAAQSAADQANKLATSLKTALKISGDKQPNQEFITTGDTLKLGKRNSDADESRYSSFRLFHHFDSYKRDYSITEKFSLDNPQVHPAFIKLGIQLAHEQVSGSNARCIAFLNTLKQFIKSYKAPSRESKTISRDLESKLKPNINFLTQCRPLAISMGNAIKEIKQIITYLPNDITETDAKEQLVDEIDNFINEKILIASDTICKYMLADSEIVISGTSYAKSKITNDDCILIYSCSSLVLNVLLRAHKKFPNLKVIVVDSRPKLKGRVSLERLAKHGINCSYVLINAISFVMSRVTKVLLGAHGLLANGYVMSTIGSSQIALVAKSFNVPVVVCCETYKFCDKVQTDAFTNNELSDPNELLRFSKKNLDHKSPLEGLIDNFESKENENINVLNLTYDITAPEFISCVVTDMGMLPCTSVPVVLRLKNRDNFLPKKAAPSDLDAQNDSDKTSSKA